MTEVRPATADDADEAKLVWEAVAAEGQWIGTELPLREGWTDRFREGVASPTTGTFVAVDGRVVGAIVMRAEIGLAHVGMAILDGYRGQGLGRRLLDAGIAWARDEARCHKVVLELWPHNDRARALYLRAGFVEEGHLHRHYRRRNGELWDAVVMGLVLDDTSPGRRSS